MPTQTLQHNTPTFSTRNINADTTNTLPSPYNSPILASDLMAFPAGGIKNANTLDELRRALNQIAKDNKAYLDGLQVQVTNNDGDITIIDTNLTEIQADLVNVAQDLSRKAWESILINPGTGLSGGGSIAADRTLNLKISSPAEIGGVRSTDTPIADNKVGESGVNGHITVNTTTGYMFVKDNGVELGAKTRGDYIKNITSTTADGITLTNGTGEGAITDLKLTDLHTTSSTFGSISDANAEGYSHGTAQNNKIRRVLVPSIIRYKFGRVITGTTTLQVNYANNNSITVTTGHGLAVAGTAATDDNTGVVYQNKGQNQTFSINHSPAVGTLADTTFVNDCPTSGYGAYTGFSGKTGAINQPETLGAITFDTFGHVKQVTKRTLTYGLDSPLTPINSNTRPYGAGLGSGFDLNVPTEADFNNLTQRVIAMQNNRVIVPGSGNIQLERDTDVTSALGGSGALTVAGNLSVATNKLKVDVSNSRVGINKTTPAKTLDVVGNGEFTTNLTIGTYVDVGTSIRHKGDTNTTIGFTTNTIDFSTAGSNRLRIKSDGKIGIGTTAPKNKLQVIGSSDDAISASFSGGIEVANTVNANDGGNRAFGFLSLTDSATMIGGNLRLDETVSGTTHDGFTNGTNDRGGAGIIFENANDNARGEIRFVQSNDTNDDTYTVLERMTIDHLGRVGIGTTAPQARLHVKAPTVGAPSGGTSNTAANSPSAIFDTTVECHGNLVVKGDFNLQNGITFDNWEITATSGNVTAGGTQTFTNTTDSTSAGTGAVKTSGGLGVAKNLNVGGNTQLGNASGDTVGFGSNQLVFGLMGPDNTYGIGYGGGTSLQSGILDDSPNGDRWRMYQSHRLPNPTAAGVANESIHNDGVTYTTGSQDYLVFEKQDGNQQSMDGGFVFISNGFEDDGNTTQAKKHFRIRNTDAKFYQNLEVAGNTTLSGTLGVTGAATLTNNLTVNAHTTLGNSTLDTTTVSGDFTAGNSESSERNKLFFDSSQGRLGIGETAPTAHFSTGAKIDILSANTGVSELILRGAGQGAGRLYVGQSNDHGGGIQYEGQKSNVDLGIGSEDHIQFFRRSSSTDELVFEYAQGTNGAVKFNMPIQMTSATAGNKNITGANIISATTLNGTLGTAAQPNITSLGTLTSATISGDLQVSGDTFFVDHSSDTVRVSSSTSTVGSASGNRFTVGGVMASTGPDFRLWNSARSEIGSVVQSHAGRALVHGTGNELILNYQNDFSGGTRIGSDFYIRTNNGQENVGIGTTTNLDSKLTVKGAVKLWGQYGRFVKDAQTSTGSRLFRKEYLQFKSTDGRTNTETGSDSARIYSEQSGTNDGSNSSSNSNVGTLVLEIGDDLSGSDSFIIRGAKSDKFHNKARFAHNAVAFNGDAITNTDEGLTDTIKTDYSHYFSTTETRIGNTFTTPTDNVFAETEGMRGGLSINQTINGTLVGIARSATAIVMNNTNDSNNDGAALQFRRQGVVTGFIKSQNGTGHRLSMVSPDGKRLINITQHQQPLLTRPTIIKREFSVPDGGFDDGHLQIHGGADSNRPHLKLATIGGTTQGKIYHKTNELIVETVTGSNGIVLRGKSGIGLQSFGENRSHAYSIGNKLYGKSHFTQGFTVAAAQNKPVMEAGFTNRTMQQLYLPHTVLGYQNSLGHRQPVKVEYGEGTATSVVTQGSTGDYYDGRNADGKYVGETDMTYTAFNSTDLDNARLKNMTLAQGQGTQGNYTYYNTHVNNKGGTPGHSYQTDPANDTVPAHRTVDLRLTYDYTSRVDLEILSCVGTVENIRTEYRIEVGRGTSVDTARYYPIYDGIGPGTSTKSPSEALQGWPNNHFIKFYPHQVGNNIAKTFADGHEVGKWSASEYTAANDDDKKWRYVRVTRRTTYPDTLATVDDDNNSRILRLGALQLLSSYTSDRPFGKQDNGGFKTFQSHDGERHQSIVNSLAIVGPADGSNGASNSQSAFNKLSAITNNHGQQANKPKKNGSLFVQGDIISEGTVKGAIEIKTGLTGDVTLNLDEANTFILTITGDVNLTLGRVSEMTGAYFTFIIKNEGNFDINFPSEMLFSGGDPKLTQGGATGTPKVDMLSMVCDGTNLFGGLSPDLKAS